MQSGASLDCSIDYEPTMTSSVASKNVYSFLFTPNEFHFILVPADNVQVMS